MSSTVSRPPDDSRARLLHAWKAWDRAPANKQAAQAFEGACQVFAGHNALHLRRHLAACRRYGMTYTQAVASWEADW